jgi:CRP-like cAMP-binding protein
VQGDDGDQVHVIQQGVVVIVNAEGAELSRKGPKDYFGELSLLKNEPRAATVRAITPTSVLSLKRYK